MPTIEFFARDVRCANVVAMTETTRRLRELIRAGVDVCVVTAPRPSYCVYSEDGMRLEDGALTASEAAEARALGARLDDGAERIAFVDAA